MVLFILVFIVKLLDAELSAFRLVEMLVNDGCLRLAEANEVDDVGEDFDQAFARWLVQVLEREIMDAALGAVRTTWFEPQCPACLPPSTVFS